MFVKIYITHIHSKLYTINYMKYIHIQDYKQIKYMIIYIDFIQKGLFRLSLIIILLLTFFTNYFTLKYN